MATITMQASEVIEAANRTIDRIMKVRAEKDAAKVTKAMQPCKRMFFKQRTRSEQEAIAHLKETEGFPFYPSCYAWGDLEKAKSLRKLAEHGDPVTLNENDIEVLF